MPCPVLPEITVTADALGRIKFNQYLNDYDVGDTLEVLDVWLKEVDDVAVPAANQRPGWLTSSYSFSQSVYTGSYTNRDGDPESGTIKRGTLAFDIDGNDPALNAGSHYLIGVEGTDGNGDPVEGEFCLRLKNFSDLLALLVYAHNSGGGSIHGGILGGGADSLNTQRAQTSPMDTSSPVHDLAWDPVREEVLYTSPIDRDVYRSVLGSSDYELVFATGKLIYALEVKGRDLYVAAADTLYIIDLDTLAEKESIAIPQPSHAGLAVLGDEVYLLCGISSPTLYRVDGDVMTSVRGSLAQSWRLCVDGGYLYWTTASDIYRYDVGGDVLTALGWHPASGAAAFLVVGDEVYSGTSQISRYNLAGTVLAANLFSITKPASAIIGINKDLS